MIVDATIVKEIAELAQLDITAQQLPIYIESLNKVLNLVTQIQAVDTEGVEPMANPFDATQCLGQNHLRRDEVLAGDDRELYQSLAAKTADGFYLVPKVIE